MRPKPQRRVPCIYNDGEVRLLPASEAYNKKRQISKGFMPQQEIGKAAPVAAHERPTRQIMVDDEPENKFPLDINDEVEMEAESPQTEKKKPGRPKLSGAIDK